MCANPFGLVFDGENRPVLGRAASNQELEPCPVFLLSDESVCPADPHEGWNVHGDVGQGDLAAHHGVFRQTLIHKGADPASANIFSHTTHKEFWFLENIQSS